MENITLMRTPGYPMSGGTGAYTFGDASRSMPAPTAKCVHQVKQVRRERAVYTAVRVQAPIAADLLSELSASTSERRT